MKILLPCVLGTHRASDKPLQPNVPSSTREHETWEALKTDRITTDRTFIDWAMRVTEDELIGDYSWRSVLDQIEMHRPKWVMVIQLFNHGTHHRGQVHAMLTAAGAKPDDTDVQFLKSEYLQWSDL